MKLEIFQEAIKYYEDNKDGHDLNHIKDVLINATKIVKEAIKHGENINKELIEVGILYHDTGNVMDRKNHHIHSAEIVRNSKVLKRYYSPEEIDMIAKICEEHRSSRKEDCSNEMCAIVNDADSMNGIERMIERCYHYNKRFNDSDEENMINIVRNHLNEKFGKNGYQTYRSKYTLNILNKEELCKILSDQELFKSVYEKVIFNKK